MKVRSNQYGFPCKTYYYIVDSENRIYHTDGKWRKKSLKQLLTHAYFSEKSALEQLEKLQHE